MGHKSLPLVVCFLLLGATTAWAQTLQGGLDQQKKNPVVGKGKTPTTQRPTTQRPTSTLSSSNETTYPTEHRLLREKRTRLDLKHQGWLSDLEQNEKIATESSLGVKDPDYDPELSAAFTKHEEEYAAERDRINTRLLKIEREHTPTTAPKFQGNTSPTTTKGTNGGATGGVNAVNRSLVEAGAKQIRQKRYSELNKQWKSGAITDAEYSEGLEDLDGEFDDRVGDDGGGGGGFLGDFGSQLLQRTFGVATSVGGRLLDRWMTGQSTDQDRALLSQMVNERDRAMAQQADPNNYGNGQGNPIYDANGNIIGYDRDLDGKEDFDSSGNSTATASSGGWGSETDLPEDAQAGSSSNGAIYDASGKLLGYDVDGDGVMDIKANPDRGTTASLGNVSGGGASQGGSSGAGLGGSGGGDSDADSDDDEDEEDEGEEDEDEEDEDEEDEGEEALADADEKDKKKNKKGAGDDQELAKFTGRFMVLPKQDFTPGVSGNRQSGGGESWSWGDDDDNWDGSNGDWGDWSSTDNGNDGASEENGDGWGDWPTGDESESAGAGNSNDPWAAGNADNGGQDSDELYQNNAWDQPQGRASAGTTATSTDPTTARLKQDLIRVEAEIRLWQRQERQRLAMENDPYGFKNDSSAQGMEGSGYEEEVDPLADFRTPDGVLDLNRVDIWLIADTPRGQATWKVAEDQAAVTVAPIRYKVEVGDEALSTFQPIQGGYVVVEGLLSEVPGVDPNLIQELGGGEVKKLEVVRWLGSSKEPPESDGQWGGSGTGREWPNY